MLDFRVRTFLCVCQTLNYTKAAQQLHITQPAVSAHIRYVETYYQVQLFHYQNRKLELTAAGKLLYQRLRTLTNDETQLQAELHAPQQETEQFSLGVTMTVGEYAIIKPLTNLLKQQPHLNLHLHFGNTAQLLEQLKEGSIQKICMSTSTIEPRPIFLFVRPHMYLKMPPLIPSKILSKNASCFVKKGLVHAIYWNAI